VKGIQRADLTWSGATGPASTSPQQREDHDTANDGAYTDNIGLKVPALRLQGVRRGHLDLLERVDGRLLSRSHSIGGA